MNCFMLLLLVYIQATQQNRIQYNSRIMETILLSTLPMIHGYEGNAHGNADGQ